MLNLHNFRSRENAIRKTIGVSRDYTVLDKRNAYTTYFNPSTGVLTGIRDNERDIFYKYTQQEDIIKFVSMINLKETRYSEFIQSIELELKKFVDREVELFDTIKELELSVEELRKENKDLKHQLSFKDVEF